MINFKSVFLSIAIFNLSLIFCMNQNSNIGDFEKFPREILSEVLELDFDIKKEEFETVLVRASEEYCEKESIKLKKLQQILNLRVVNKKFKSIVDSKYKDKLSIIKNNIKNKKDGLGLKMIERYKRSENIEKFISSGANLNVKTDTMGWTILSWACNRMDLDFVQTLLKKGVDPNIANDIGNTAIMYSYDNFLRKNNKSTKAIMILLLAHGADINIKNNEGKSILNNSFQLEELIEEANKFFRK